MTSLKSVFRTQGYFFNPRVSCLRLSTWICGRSWKMRRNPSRICLGVTIRALQSDAKKSSTSAVVRSFCASITRFSASYTSSWWKCGTCAQQKIDLFPVCICIYMYIYFVCSCIPEFYFSPPGPGGDFFK